MSGGLPPFAARNVILELMNLLTTSSDRYLTFSRKCVTNRLLLFAIPFWNMTIA